MFGHDRVAGKGTTGEPRAKGGAPRSAGIVLAAVFFACLALASAASAADGIYWANEESPISHADLDGSGGGADLGISGPLTENLEGIAIDPVGAKIYWSNWQANVIGSASLGGGAATRLDTGGATIDYPEGVAIDPAAGKIYWASNEGGPGGTGAIGYANLDGSGGAGDLNTAGAKVEYPWGLAIDPAGGRIYWSNDAGGISYASLGGLGGGNLNTAGATAGGAEGIAIDPATGRVYWANNGADTISYASLDGSGGGDLDPAGATVDHPIGVAVDPASGKLYWTSSPSAGGAISSADVAGGGAADLDTTGATTFRPALLALFKAPTLTSAPVVGGGPQPGSTLTCSQGSWAPDGPASQLYQSPQGYAYQWSDDGEAIAGATAATLVATQPGSYACQVTATNAAGSTGAASAGFTVAYPLAVAHPLATIQLTKMKLNRRKGTAILFARVSGAGGLTLTGKGTRRRQGTSHGAGVVKLAIKAVGTAKKRLAKQGKAKVAATVTFAPSAGAAVSATRSITLERRPSRHG